MSAPATRMTEAMRPTTHRPQCACALCARVPDDQLHQLARAYQVAPTRAAKIRAGLDLLEFLDGKDTR